MKRINLFRIRTFATALTALLIVALSEKAQAQDPQFTQFYAAPLYMNPAFAGNVDYFCDNNLTRLRGSMSYRQQWNFFTTQAFAVDYLFPADKVGVGFQVWDDRANNTGYRAFNVSGTVSYKLAFASAWRFHSGLQLAYGNRSINPASSYTYPDQYSARGFLNITSLDEKFAQQQVGYPTIGLGGLLFNNIFWLGLSAFNINSPNIAFTNGTAPLQTRASLHTGFRIALRKPSMRSEAFRDMSVSPNIQLRRMGTSTQLDLGMYFTNEPLILGMWYRGLPVVKNAEGSINQDAVALLIGYKGFLNNLYFKVAYSHDVTISKLTYSNGRAHELTLSFQIIDEKCKTLIKNRGVTPCPSY